MLTSRTHSRFLGLAFAGLTAGLALTASAQTPGAPAAASPSTSAANAPGAKEALILTPKPSPKPRITGAKVFGVHPGSPFIFTVTATGDKPMTFSAKGLPSGLSLNKKTGHITGKIKKAGEFKVTLTAKNALGSEKREFKIVCGSQIGLTPAMGWNSWNCFAQAVTAEKIKSAADAMVTNGLIDHGWTYINIDDFWEVNRNSTDKTLQGPKRDDAGKIIPNPRFPDMKALTSYVHDKGLKIGIYSSPGPWTCGGCVASFNYELQDAQQYADWGFDYLKYDWCSYSPALETNRGNTNFNPSAVQSISRGQATLAQRQFPYKLMYDALAKQPRDILYSLCQYGDGNVWEWGTNVGGNSWRTTGDIQESWSSMSGNGFRQAGHEKYAGPGHFNDPDMLIVGKIGWGNVHPTRLTPNEQYTHISLWCLLASPLLIGCDMTQMDDFTLNLLSNDEVLDINQDPLGHQAARVASYGPDATPVGRRGGAPQPAAPVSTGPLTNNPANVSTGIIPGGTLEVWAKDLEDGSKAIGLFNRGADEQTVTVNWSDLGINGMKTVRDLWRQQDLGQFADKYEAKVASHGVVLIKIKK